MPAVIGFFFGRLFAELRVYACWIVLVACRLLKREQIIAAVVAATTADYASTGARLTISKERFALIRHRALSILPC